MTCPRSKSRRVKGHIHRQCGIETILWPITLLFLLLQNLHSDFKLPNLKGCPVPGSCHWKALGGRGRGWTGNESCQPPSLEPSPHLCCILHWKTHARISYCRKLYCVASAFLQHMHYVCHYFNQIAIDIY